MFLLYDKQWDTIGLYLRQGHWLLGARIATDHRFVSMEVLCKFPHPQLVHLICSVRNNVVQDGEQISNNDVCFVPLQQFEEMEAIVFL